MKAIKPKLFKDRFLVDKEGNVFDTKENKSVECANKSNTFGGMYRLNIGPSCFMQISKIRLIWITYKGDIPERKLICLKDKSKPIHLKNLLCLTKGDLMRLAVKESSKQPKPWVTARNKARGKPVIINGVRYINANEAGRQLGVSGMTISYHVKKGTEGHSYEN